jgi:predicted GNAT superfamily acetyltransferase
MEEAGNKRERLNADRVGRHESILLTFETTARYKQKIVLVFRLLDTYEAGLGESSCTAIRYL